MNAPRTLSAEERARIARDYGVENVPETVKRIPRGESAYTIDVDPKTGNSMWLLKASGERVTQLRGDYRGRAKKLAVAAEKRRPKVKELALGGMSITKIAEAVGSKRDTVRADLLVLGLTHIVKGAREATPYVRHRQSPEREAPVPAPRQRKPRVRKPKAPSPEALARKAVIEARRASYAGMIAKGLTQRQMAAEHGVSYQLVRNEIQALGLSKPMATKRKPPPLTEAHKARLAAIPDLLAQGITKAEIARRFGVTPGRITQDVKRLGAA